MQLRLPGRAGIPGRQFLSSSPRISFFFTSRRSPIALVSVCAATNHKLTASSVHESRCLFSAATNRETLSHPYTIVLSRQFSL